MVELVCIGCPKGCHLNVDVDHDYKVTGNSCPVGAEYGRNELLNPTRVLTTTVHIIGGNHACLPVKTNGAIPKRLLVEAVKALREISVKAPIHEGDVVVKNLLDTGIDVVASRDM